MTERTSSAVNGARRRPWPRGSETAASGSVAKMRDFVAHCESWRSAIVSLRAIVRCSAMEAR